MRSGDSLSRSHHRLFRSPDDRVFLGICGGLAEYLGVRSQTLRALFIVSLVLSAGWTLLAYLVLGFVVARKPESYRYSREESAFWRSVEFNPRDTFASIKHSFARIDRRLRKIESYVTSRTYELDKEFADLEKSQRKRP